MMVQSHSLHCAQFLALISDNILPAEKRIINVNQQPCSVRSERDVGTYVEFCRLPVMLGSSSNNNSDNNNNKNNNNISHHIPRHSTLPNTYTPGSAQDGEVRVKNQHAVSELKPQANRRSLMKKMQTQLIQTHQIIIIADYSEHLSMLSGTIVSSLW